MARILATSLPLVSLLLCTTAGAEGHPLRVASYNVFAVPVVASDIDERLEVIAARLIERDVDIVLLQELWYAPEAALVASRFEAAGLIHQRHYPAGGLWIGSRHPLRETRFSPFAAGRTPWVPWHLDWVAEKGLAHVHVDTPAGALMVGNTHLQSSYLAGDYRAILLWQISELSDWIGACGATPCERTPPLILAGDLNATPQGLAIRLLSARSALEPSSAAFDLDHLMHRSGSGLRVTVRSTEWLFTEPVTLPSGVVTLLSDHPCLLAEYLLEPCTDCEASGPVPPPSALWPAVSDELGAFIDAQRPLVSRATWLGRAGGLIALWSAWFAWRSRALGRLRAMLLPLLALAAAWLLYLGFFYGPYEARWLEALVTLRFGSR